MMRRYSPINRERRDLYRLPWTIWLQVLSIIGLEIFVYLLVNGYVTAWRMFR